MIQGAAAILTGCAGTRSRPSRPNILFAIADDQSWPGAVPLAEGALRTPALDRIAREGAFFSNSYCGAPSCTPSRSAVLTGRNIWQVEEGGVLNGTFPPKYARFTHLLEDAGYHVGFTGKPWSPGNFRAAGLTRHPMCKEFNARKMEPIPPKGVDARDYAANFDDFLAARTQDQPFMFWFGCTEPHRVYDDGVGRRNGKKLDTVLKVPSFWPDTEIVRSDILDYCWEVEWFDSHLGRMLAALERAGELDNTIVVATSDNGMPFPRAKVNCYDYGVHMPLAIRWGSRITGGRRVEDFVGHIDFAPTFLEAAGIAPPTGIAGRSLIPLLKADDPKRDAAHFALERHTWCRPDGATYPIRAIRTNRHLYVRNFAPERWPTGGPDFVSSNRTFHGDVDACPTKTFMIDPANQRKYTREYHLGFGKRPAEELYDVAADPFEVNNLATDPQYAADRQRLSARLEGYLRETGDPRIEGRDPWQGYVYHQTTGFGATFNRSLPDEERRRARERGAHKPE